MNNLHEENEALKKQIKNDSVCFWNLSQIFLSMSAGKKQQTAQTSPSIETKNFSNTDKQMYMVRVEQK